jgi:hypothetical protein
MIVKLLPVVIAAGLLLDLFSCLLFIRRNQIGGGPSGLPAATLIVCYLMPLLITENAVFTSSYLLDCLILLCFHTVVVFMIPILHRKWIEKNRSKD